jgi:hypothetical protein
MVPSVQQPSKAVETSTHTGLRDRALLGTLAYTFARIGAVVSLKVEDYYPSGKRFLLRLAPCVSVLRGLARFCFPKLVESLDHKLHNWIPTTEMVIRPAHAPLQSGWSLQLQ